MINDTDQPSLTVITEAGREHYKTNIFAGGHFIVADEPEEKGGTDEGMNPHALLLSSLGSCTAITLRMYADRKEWPLEHIRVTLSIEAEVSTENTETIIQRNISLGGALSEEQRNRLLVIADKCPIHKLLSNPIRIVTEELQ